MADKIIVEAAPRESRGKNEARRQRVAGKVPATLYGGKDAAISLTVNTKQVSQILRSATGGSPGAATSTTIADPASEAARILIGHVRLQPRA